MDVQKWSTVWTLRLTVFLLSIVQITYGQESISVPASWRVWMHILIGCVICFSCLIGFIILVNTLGWIFTKVKGPAQMSAYPLKVYQYQ